MPTTDIGAWEKLEPGTSPPSQRLRAVSQLAARDINVGVLMAPLVPGITSQRAKLDRTLRTVADSGARFVGTNILHLDGGTRDHFMKFLAQNYPDLLGRYERLYRGKYASPDYANKIQTLVNAIQAVYMPKYNRSAKADNWQQITTPGRGPTQSQAKLNWG
jgi:DNA repair photolyase